MNSRGGYLRIGELSRRVAVRPELLRAWETRYGLLTPARTQGGFRLYSDADEERVRGMQAHLTRGLSAAEAARLALEEQRGSADGVDGMPVGPEPLERARRDLLEALDAYDEGAANRVLDGLLASYGTESVLRQVVLPYLADLGERWARGEASVAQEHFASNLLRGRLLGLARGWGQGAGPRAILACVPGELHDLPLLVFGLALRTRGWRVTYLGPDTPIATLSDAAVTLEPNLVVLSAATVEVAAAVADDLREVARSWPLAVGGAGARAPQLAGIGARVLGGDPIEEADNLSAAA